VMAALVVHAVGELKPADQSSRVVTGAHRGEAFAACEFIMDYLKTQRAILEKESPQGAQLVRSARFRRRSGGALDFTQGRCC